MTDDSFDFECETSDIDDVTVKMPDGSSKLCQISACLDSESENPRERRLGQPDVTVNDEKVRLLRETTIPESSFDRYEMVIFLPQNAARVMNDSAHISDYRDDLCRGADVHLQIRLRNIIDGRVVDGPNRDPNPSHPEVFNYELKQQ